MEWERGLLSYGVDNIMLSKGSRDAVSASDWAKNDWYIANTIYGNRFKVSITGNGRYFIVKPVRYPFAISSLTIQLLKLVGN